VLRFRLGPFPVTVEVSFLIAAVFLGLNFTAVELPIWVVVVFVSVLVHELGHAFVAKALGGKPQIKLEGLGGLTLPLLQQKPGTLQRIVLSVAGPAAGLALGGVALAAERAFPLDGVPLAAFAIEQFKWTSVAWAALNMLPVLPLDGGHVLEAAIEGVRKKPSIRAAAAVSMVVAAAVAVYSYFRLHQLFLALFMVLFAAQNLAIFQRSRPRPEEPAEEEGPPQPSPLERADIARITEVARRAMAAGDPQSALAAADLLEASDGAARQAAGLRIRAGVLLAQGQLVDAGLHAGRSFTLFPQADAAVVAARANLRNGDREAAASWLRRAVEAGASLEAVRGDAELGALVDPSAAA
jgi:Zn-dependent protease